MKLYIENEGENFEMEAKAAYVVLIDPENGDVDTALMVMGQTSPLAIIKGVANTLNSFFQTLTKGDSNAQCRLWKIFKSDYKNASVIGTTRIKRNECRPVREED